MKIKVLPNLILFFSLSIINIMVPQGEILYELGFITITKDALYGGINKSSLLIGLLYLSKNISFSNIKMPGRTGLIIKDTFYYFNQLSSGERIKPKNLVDQLDKKLLELNSNQEIYNKKLNKIKNNTIIITILTLLAFSIDNMLVSF